ncbi:hypothetical protein ACLOJK_002374 [Asimina triloba]
MGKKRKSREGVAKEGGDGERCRSTLFVSNLPYSLSSSQFAPVSKSQLEETFSEVGPVRRSFLVTNKGSNEHRGFGFVQFCFTAPMVFMFSAVPEDAQRAIELKNGALMGGRKIGVKLAIHRVPLELRQSKANIVAGESKETMIHMVVHGGESDKVNCTIKQRAAKTVIFGGLQSAKMADEVFRRAREVGDVVSISYPLPEEELDLHGLAYDGCKMNAAAALYTSVKSALTSIAMLHQQEIDGGCVWARQLGGEGSKTRKWKVIVRNLPFKVTANDIKNAFSATGFAISKVNGQKIGKRTVAVDWAVSKKIYATVSDSADFSNNVTDKEDENLMDDMHGSDFAAASADDDSAGESDHLADSNIVPEEHNDSEEVPSTDMGVDETQVAMKVLNNLISSSADGPTHSKCGDSNNALNNEELKPSNAIIEGEPSVQSGEDTRGRKLGKLPKREELTSHGSNDGEDDLARTIFISNLPFEIDNEEAKQRFSAFGEVRSFLPVLHHITKRPRGTAFLKFGTEAAADAAISAANAAQGLGIVLKGRPLTILKALDKKAAQKKELEKKKNEADDPRNLYLAKEGLILEGTLAAEGVSESDMLKRQELQTKKMAKLQSPNFHVSRTRLIMYNLPRSLTENELKKLCIEAVLSRARKQKPVIRQVKFLKDEKKINAGKKHSRGVAFVEFSRHDHAIAALRGMSVTFRCLGDDVFFVDKHRPIVEFALDNVRTLQLRKNRLQSQQGSEVTPKDETLDAEEQTVPEKAKHKKIRNNDPQDDSQSSRTRKRGKGGEGVHEATKVGTEEGKVLGPTKKAAHVKGRKSQDSASAKAKHNLRNGNLPNEQDGRGLKQQHPPKEMQKAATTAGSRKPGPIEEISGALKKRKWQDGEHEKGLKNAKKKKKKSSGVEVEDKLDKLIEQYRAKFSRRSSDNTDVTKKGSGHLRRWFEA